MAFTDSNPAVGDGVQASVGEIEANFAHLKAVFENFVGTWSDSVTTGIYAAKTEGGRGIIAGDTTTGRVLRSSNLLITNAAAGPDLSLELSNTNTFQGDAIAEADLSDGETVGNFTLGSSGEKITIEAAGLTGNAVAVLAANIYINACGTDLCMDYTVTSNDIVLTPTNSTTGQAVDLVTLVNTGEIRVAITYITSA